MDDVDEIVAEFLVESYENLDQLDRDLVSLEQDPGSRELLSSIFRTIHTIKGTSGFLAFGRLESVTHVGEHLLSELRDAKRDMTQSTASALLAMVDTVRLLLAAIESTGDEGDVDVAATVQALEAIRDGDGAPETGTGTMPPPHVDPPAPSSTDVDPLVQSDTPTTSVTEPLDVIEVPASPVPTAAAPVEARTSVADSTVRVDVDLLDSLMDLVGELVIARNQIVRWAGDAPDSDVQRSAQRLNLVASELQEGVMRTRMQSVDQLWQKLPRVVRDLGVQCGREVTLTMSGNETELDRTVLEAIKDPLTHLVRNAVDHGIEPPDVRVAAGKPAQGTLALRALQEGGHVVLEISDDGAGINPARVGQIAVERGVVTAEELARLNVHETQELIFRPGFSTASSVTMVSGRGVGMDVVRTNIERIGGTVDLLSQPGHGTTVRVKIPLTLAIIPALLVENGSLTYAIPQANLVELVRLDTERQQLEQVAGAPVYRLRGQLLPVIDLAEQMGGTSTLGATAELNLVVLHNDGFQFGLVVEQVLDTQEIVVKPLSTLLAHLDCYAGASVMGDGSLALILDVRGLAHRVSGPTTSSRAATTVDGDDDDLPPSRDLLVVSLGGGVTAAVDLPSVSRLEEIEASAIEQAGDIRAVQYRGGLLPIVDLPHSLSVGPPHGAILTVVVCEADGATVGLVVDHVIDVASTTDTVSPLGRRRWIDGTLVLHGSLTQIVSVPSVAAHIYPQGALSV
ncbi:chemotaxis protein CheW [Solicola sp. PLA-1-18]|uniref:chemotaxis protein CheW n=1 Tax=Solicola sp. PLA-1-18 TaxID=3380532 RepID=UPI003B7E2752